MTTVNIGRFAWRETHDQVIEWLVQLDPNKWGQPRHACPADNRPYGVGFCGGARECARRAARQAGG